MTKEVSPGTGGGVRRGEHLTNFGGVRCTKCRDTGFTLIELVLVVGIILVLSALVLSTVGYARKKSAFARAETEIAAISAACENYKADNAVYPSTSATNNLDARTMLDPQTANATTYKTASLILYRAISGDRNLDRVVNATDGSFDIDGTTLDPPPSQLQPPRSYFAFKPNMLFPPNQTQNVQYIQDPFGNSYGYSTANQADPITPKGYNPTFDVWSTAGVAPSPTPNPPATQQGLWIKNW
jgi:prepilin-type N-terminal cleavage/methylation domain-containing protein